jgi:flagellar biogenesis protein FliO
MSGYVINFTVYTLAMTGLICFAVFVYKKITDGSFRSNNSKYLSVEETMSLSPRKTLHVVRAGNEKFLIASDVDRTTLISKLEWNKGPEVKTTNKFRDIPKAKNVPEKVIQKPEADEVAAEQKDDKIVHLETIYPVKKKVAVRSGTKVQRRRTMPKPAVEPEDYTKHGFSPIKEMAKRINEL